MQSDGLTVESLIGELGLELVCGQESAHAHVRWVHSTELPIRRLGCAGASCC